MPGAWIEHATSRTPYGFSLLLSQLSYPGDTETWYKFSIYNVNVLILTSS